MGKREYFFLYPFSLLYRLATDIRNFLYDKGFLTPTEFSIPIICAGNITVGGTGKTPHTEYLVRLLHEKFRVAVLSRGYKRQSTGFRVVTPSSTVGESGDEPLQIALKFPDILVAVDRDRVNGIRTILKEFPLTEAIILDDGFQHRSLKPGFSILLTDFKRLMTRDQLMPYGNLRESKKNMKRADLILVTKSPEDISAETIDEITKELKKFGGREIFFTSLKYDAPLPLFKDSVTGPFSLSRENRGNLGVVLVTGIASAGPLKEYLGKYFTELEHLDFPDHHCFSGSDIEKITHALNNLKASEKYIITTEKDAVRIREFTNIALPLKTTFFYIPIGVKFLNDAGYRFENLIIEYVRRNNRNNGVPQN